MPLLLSRFKKFGIPIVVACRIAALYREHLPAEHFIEELSSATSQIKLRANDTLTLVGTEAEVDEAVRYVARNGQ